MNSTMLLYMLCSVFLLAVCVGCIAFMLWACMPSDEMEDDDDCEV